MSIADELRIVAEGLHQIADDMSLSKKIYTFNNREFGFVMDNDPHKIFRVVANGPHFLEGSPAWERMCKQLCDHFNED